MSKKQDQEITVNDRRMFNPDGTLRAEFTEAVATEPVPTVQEPSPVPPPSEEDKNAARAKTPSTDFSNLVGMLATNAILHLGGDPQLGRGRVDIETARHFIDMLSALQEKTEGNLTDGEKQLLEDMLSRLRMEYVTIVNQMSMSAKKQV